ncbi:MAG: OmpA family protein [Phycisphaerae bacterium]
MKTYLAKPLAVAMLAALLLGSGCVSVDKYNEALAATRRANEALTQAKNAVRDMRTENQRLLGDIEARDGVIAAREKALTELQSSHDKLGEDFKALYAKYQDEIARGKTPTPFGPLLPAVLDKALSEFAAANPDLVEYLPKYGMVKLKSDLTFDKGSVDIKVASGDALRKFVAIVNTPDAQKFHIYIAGHTDDIPIRKPGTLQHHPDNWYLSVHRSVAVQKVLTSAGLASERIGVLGFSEYHPVAANKAGNKGNQANRRVEIWIVPPDKFLTAKGD